MRTADILKTFMLEPAPSGYEKAMAFRFRDAMKPYADTVSIDYVGNVLAHFPGRDPDAPVMMIYAHMDQLGFVVRKIEPTGFLRMERLGGIPEKVLPGLRLSIRTKQETWIPGIFANKSHHVTPADEKYMADRIDSLFVDIGAKDARAVHEQGVQIGSPAIYQPSFCELAGGKITGTAIDNRGGLTALLLLARQLKEQPTESTVWLVGTVWEEFNLRGAIQAARAIHPDIAIALDVVLSGDTPDLAGRFDITLGKGPAMMLYNFHGRGTLNGTIPHPGLTELAEQAAEKANIPLQRFAGVGILTDSAYVQLEERGIPALELGFPARYTHTPVEVCDPADIEQLGRLLFVFTCLVDGSFDPHRYS